MTGLRRTACLALALTAWAPQAGALEILQTEVSHEERVYHVVFEFRIDADRDRAYRLLTDFDHLQRLSKSITESRILAYLPDGEVRVKVAARGCVLFVCKTITTVGDVTEVPGGEIITRVVPSGSDFSSGVQRWWITGDRHNTVVRYQATMVPRFFIPPLIGPLLVEATIRRHLEHLAARLEALARP